MSMYLNSSIKNTHNNSTKLFKSSSSNINSSSFNSENFNTLRSKKQSLRTPKNNDGKFTGKVKTTRRVLGDISNNGYTPKNKVGNNATKANNKTTSRKILGDISNNHNKNSKNNSNFATTTNLKSSKKVLSYNNSSFKKQSSSSFILEDKVTNINTNNSILVSSKKSKSSLQKKKIQETSIFVDNNNDTDTNTTATISCHTTNILKLNQGDINTEVRKKHEADDDGSVSSIERPAGRMWHEQYFSDDDENNFRLDIKEIKDDINEINSSMFGRTKNDFEEYEKELNKKMEEVLFSHDPYKDFIENDPFEDDLDDMMNTDTHPPSYFRDDFDIDDVLLP